MDAEDVINKILERTSFSRDEVKKKILKRQKDLGDLISFEGAAHLVAKDYGIELSSNTRRALQIRNIVSGMKNVTFSGRIFKISNIVDFKKSDGVEGKVVNIFLGDESGICKVALWNDQVKFVEEETIKVGDIIKIVGGFAKENPYGDMEVSLGKYGKIAASEYVDMPSVERLLSISGGSDYPRTSVKNVVPGSFQLRATIIDVANSNFIYSVCPLCGKSVDSIDGNAKCVEHGEIEPNNAVFVNVSVDDGTGDMKAIFFRAKAEMLMGMAANEISQIQPEKRVEIIKEKVLGKELLLDGKVRNNKVFNRLEMLVDEFKEINPLEESKRIVEEVELELSV